MTCGEDCGCDELDQIRAFGESQNKRIRVQASYFEFLKDLGIEVIR